jgi:hypothetical protein
MIISAEFLVELLMGMDVSRVTQYMEQWDVDADGGRAVLTLVVEGEDVPFDVRHTMNLPIPLLFNQFECNGCGERLTLSTYSYVINLSVFVSHASIGTETEIPYGRKELFGFDLGLSIDKNMRMSSWYVQGYSDITKLRLIAPTSVSYLI